MARILSLEFIFFGVVAVLMAIHPYRALSDEIFDTEKDEDKYNLIFLLGAGISR